MASTVVYREPAVDYSTLLTQTPQNTISPSYAWDPNSYPDPAPVSTGSCDLAFPSLTSPDSLIYADPNNSYTLSEDGLNPDVKCVQAFNFAAYQDWMRWFNPSNAKLSLISDFFPVLKLEPIYLNMGQLELQGSGVGSVNTVINHLAISQAQGESAVSGKDPNIKDQLFRTPGALISLPTTEVQRGECLYSTPLSWSRPVHDTRRTHGYNDVLSPQRESKLRDIAMPFQPQQQYSAPLSSAPSPEPCEDNRRKRKPSVEDDDQEDLPLSSNGRHPPDKKAVHSMVEKRYRTNLNDKIAALRDSVPSLRVMSKKNSRKEVQEDLRGLQLAHKLNKATVLSKATEYIMHLEKRNKSLTKKNASLNSQLSFRDPHYERPITESEAATSTT